jgi:RND family efflux transporter MFP subunit
MTTREQVAMPRGGKLPYVIGRPALVVVLAGSLVLLLLVLAGVFKNKVPTEQLVTSGVSISDLSLAEVRLIRQKRYETAVGTVRAVHEAAIASKLLARVVELPIKAGQAVTRDEVLARLDDADLQARLKQAEAALDGAKAAKDRADQDYDRTNRLWASRAASQEDLDRATAARKTATAELARADQAVHEASVLLDFAIIRAPLTGIVIDKRVEVGDTVSPGQVLLTLFNPNRMQLIVTVRESLAQRLAVGQKVRGRLEALDHECEATISEIVPEAQAASRSFTVKATGPCPPGVYSGMFGRIFISLDDEELLVVPAGAVERVGQLDTALVVEGENVRRRSLQLGRTLDQGYEVLAGLKAGEKVVLLRQGRKEVRR